jgi:hypothetical protein
VAALILILSGGAYLVGESAWFRAHSVPAKIKLEPLGRTRRLRDSNTGMTWLEFLIGFLGRRTLVPPHSTGQCIRYRCPSPEAT